MSTPVSVPDTRPLFRPVRNDLIRVLASLSATDWDRPTLAPAWKVRDVVSHMVDTALRRLSYHRDQLPPPAASTPLATEQDLAALVNELNASWVRAARRFSPRVLTDLYAAASAALCDFIESLPDDPPALFRVSWAGGEHESEGLLDIGREFTEVWHHGAQIRDAVGAGLFGEPRWLHAVLTIAVHALPHAYRDVPAAVGATVAVEITGEAGGSWMLARGVSGWDLTSPADPDATAGAILSDDDAWRLFFNALPERSLAAVRMSGDLELARPLLRARSVIV